MIEDQHVATVGLEEKFAGWIQPLSTEAPPTVLVGAGLSFSLVPIADAYGVEIGLAKSKIESSLGVSSPITPSDAASLYKWAGDCMQQLVATGSDVKSAKLLLAKAMGVSDDGRFQARTNVPLRGTTPRHRVLGRLAREGRIDSFWSFNWDCWLESSLEAVGLRLGDETPRLFTAPVSWRLRYHVWFSGAGASTKLDTVEVFKAHGCARALYSGESEFVVTEEEMALPLNCQPQERIHRMEKGISSRWAVAVGWSATENYVKQLIEKLGGAGALGDKITIVDIDVVQSGHLEVCASYKCEAASSGVRVSGVGPGTTDDLFLWIQTRRGFESLHAACAGITELQAELRTADVATPAFNSGSFRLFGCVPFMDSWLPIWLRTCFMVKAQAHRPALGNDNEILPTAQRDAHIPWAPLSDERHDLQAAAVMLSRLRFHEGADVWDFETFPGALWDASEQRLVLPLPIWAEVEDISAISLKPLFDSSHWKDKARIGSLHILLLNSPSKSDMDSAELGLRSTRWKESLAGSFGHRHLAVPDNILEISLDQLVHKAELGIAHA